MIIKFDGTQLDVLDAKQGYEHHRIDDLIILVSKEGFTPIEIAKNLKVKFYEQGSNNIRAEFGLAVTADGKGDKYSNYNQCILISSGTSFIQAGTYTISINEINSDIPFDLEEYYDAKPVSNDIEYSDAKIFFEDKNDSISTEIEFTFSRYIDIFDLIACQPIIKMINNYGEKHIQYINGYKLIDNNIVFNWRFDDFAESSDSLLFSVCFITPDNKAFLQTEIKKYIEIIVNIKNSETDEVMTSTERKIAIANLEDNFYAEFEKWMSLRAYYLMEGNFELRDAQNSIDIIDRNIMMSQNTNTLVKHDHKSQLITFRIKRYQDGIDISKKNIYIKYRNAEGSDYRAKAVNLIVDEEYIFFSWLITMNVTKEAGTVSFAIEITGSKDNDKNWYLWQTGIATIEVLDTLIFDDDIVVDAGLDLTGETWYSEIQAKLMDIEEKVSEKTNSASVNWQML